VLASTARRDGWRSLRFSRGFHGESLIGSYPDRKGRSLYGNQILSGCATHLSNELGASTPSARSPNLPLRAPEQEVAADTQEKHLMAADVELALAVGEVVERDAARIHARGEPLDGAS
jgi:hypothetical protein